jgi:alkylation response protein AidB-like acyl-CoA dehydrogenase
MDPTSIPRPTRRLIIELEGLLGDPLAPSGPFSFAEIVAHDERDAIPPGAVETLHGWGLISRLVPQSVGGRLLNVESARALIRSVARRNLTMVVKYGSTWLGTGPVWLWGTPEQRKLVAEGVLAGDTVCFGVSEADAGSDVAATATTARRDGDRYILDGEKWPVGNATEGRFITVLAQGPSGPLVLLVDKEDLPPGCFTPKPTVRTLGLRGHDLSGIAFHGTPVPTDAVVGRPGRGTRDVLRCMQVTRTVIGEMCGSGSGSGCDAVWTSGRACPSRRASGSGPPIAGPLWARPGSVRRLGAGSSRPRPRSGPDADGRSRSGVHYGGARGPFCWCRRRNPHRTGRPSPIQDPSAEIWLTRPQPPGTEHLGFLLRPDKRIAAGQGYRRIQGARVDGGMCRLRACAP